MDLAHTVGDHQNHSVTAPTDLMEAPQADEDKQDRTLRSLQVAAITGFVGEVRDIQESCLSLCNTCRQHVPVERLMLCAKVPPSMLAIVFPGLQLTEQINGLSRVLPPRRVLKVQCEFNDSPTHGRSVEDEEENKDDGAEGQSVDDCGSYFAEGVNVDISQIRWPEETKEVVLFSLNRRIDAMALPEGLERLAFCDSMQNIATYFTPSDMFNTPLDGVSFPGGLREILLGDSFNQPIEGVAWPGGLELLSLPGFNQSIRDVQWPPGLKALEFVSHFTIWRWADGCIDDVDDNPRDYIVPASAQRHGKFNQPLGTTLPPSLEKLWLSEEFDHSLDGVVWPSGIVTLGLAFNFYLYRYPTSVTWPSNLRELFMMNRSVEEMSYPQDSKVSILNTFEDVHSVDSYDPGKSPDDDGDY